MKVGFFSNQLYPQNKQKLNVYLKKNFGNCNFLKKCMKIVYQKKRYLKYI